MYYLRVNKEYLTTKVDPEIKMMLGYTEDYTYGELLLPFEYNGEMVEYIDQGDTVIVQLRLPGAFVKDGKDRALNKCVRGEIQPKYLYYAYGKFGIKNILTQI